jgi:hypothetical protein
MLDWVAKVFRSWVEVVLWLILIIFTIGGGVIGNTIGRYSRGGGYTFWGIVLGLGIGLIAVVIGGGLIANFLDLADNVALLKKKFYEDSVRTPPVDLATVSETFKVSKLPDETKIKIKCPICNRSYTIHETHDSFTTFQCSGCNTKITKQNAIFED